MRKSVRQNVEKWFNRLRYIAMYVAVYNYVALLSVLPT